MLKYPNNLISCLPDIFYLYLFYLTLELSSFTGSVGQVRSWLAEGHVKDTRERLTIKQVRVTNGVLLTTVWGFILVFLGFILFKGVSLDSPFGQMLNLC